MKVNRRNQRIAEGRVRIRPRYLRVDQHAGVEHTVRIELALGGAQRGCEQLRPLPVVPGPMVAADGVMMGDGAAGFDQRVARGAYNAQRGASVPYVEVAHAGPVHLVLTARAENYIHGRPDLPDTIARLQAYQAAGADVLFAPGMRDLEEINAVVQATDRPVNVLALPGGPPAAELAAVGVSRISVGGAFAFAALGSLVQAAQELSTEGTYGFWELARIGSKAAREAFND